jgi:hypothetical protein
MKRRRCFVISPIGRRGSDVRKHADRVFDSLIKPATEMCGLEAYRSDHLPEPGRISEQMFRAILRDDCSIVLLTGNNPNVFYELAVAQCAEKPVILLLKEGDDLPFDIWDLRCIYYDPDLRSFDDSITTLTGHIRSLKAQRWVGKSPLTLYAQEIDKLPRVRYHRDLRNDERICYLLRGIKEYYWRTLADTQAPTRPQVRLNIMAPRRNSRVKEPVLRMVAADYIDDYDDEEQHEKWSEEDGKVGAAWLKAKQQIYAADIDSPETEFEPMGEKSEAAKKIKSVVSTPIFFQNKLIAILSMDSFQGGKETLVTTTGVKELFKRCARELGSLLVEQ